jgi:hypothetical protein
MGNLHDGRASNPFREMGALFAPDDHGNCPVGFIAQAKGGQQARAWRRTRGEAVSPADVSNC